MKIYHVAAHSENRAIGKDGKIPWHIREDMLRFKEITFGHPVIMGRLTFESLGKYAPLPSRRNIILSSRDELFYDGLPVLKKEDGIKPLESPKGTEVALANSIEEALSLCDDVHEIYIIGGGGVYKDTLDLADELRLTIVHRNIEGADAFYPEIDEEVWVPSFVEPKETHTYIDYVRKNPVCD